MVRSKVEIYTSDPFSFSIFTAFYLYLSWLYYFHLLVVFSSDFYDFELFEAQSIDIMLCAF